MCIVNFTDCSRTDMYYWLRFVNCGLFSLQANVMLEYNLDDAQTLLTKNEEAASKSLNQVEEELSYITDQTTTLEVSILSKTIFVRYESVHEIMVLIT